MTETKKTAADVYLEAFDLKRQNILTAEEFEKERAEILNRPVFKEDDALAELSQWSDIKSKGGITAEEFEARKKILLAPNKPSVHQPVPVAAPAPAPAPAAPAKKKRRGCGCFTAIILAAGALGLCSLVSCFGSNDNKTQENTGNTSGARIGIRQQAPRSDKPVEVENALNQSEPWRAELTQRMQAAGLDEETQQLIHNGMSKISLFNEWQAQHNASQAHRDKREFTKVDRCEQYKRELLECSDNLAGQVKPGQQALWNNVINPLYRRVANQLMRGEITFDPLKVGQEMIARVKAERTRQQVQSRTVQAGR